MMDELATLDYHSTWRLLYPLHLGPSAYKSKAKYGRPLTVRAREHRCVVYQKLRPAFSGQKDALSFQPSYYLRSCLRFFSLTRDHRQQRFARIFVFYSNLCYAKLLQNESSSSGCNCVWRIEQTALRRHAFCTKECWRRQIVTVILLYDTISLWFAWCSKRTIE